MMDKLTIFSGALFLVSDIFAIASLSLPDWIVTDIGGETRLGLLTSCETLYDREPVCYTPSLGGAWMITFACILMGCLCITTTIFLLFYSLCATRGAMTMLAYARWVGFTAMVSFCFAAVIFPIGFHVEEIGGQPYQLPNSYKVGYSYIFFVLSLWLTVVSELFAGKVCLPHF